MKRRAGSRRRNFSLIEILTVIAIIGVLSAIALGVVSLVKTKMAESRTRATLEKISLTLNSLQSKFGYFPNAVGGMLVISTQVSDVKNLAAANVDLGGHNGTKSIYPAAYLNGFVSIVELDNLKNSCIVFPVEINGTTKDVVVLADALEHPILYASPGQHNTGTFDLASAGVDGNIGDQDPAAPLVDSGALSTTSTEKFDAKTSDDITNF